MATAQKSNQEKAKASGEKKVAAFKKLATKRTNTALDKIARILPLSNTRSYTFDKAQTDKIVSALEAEVAKVKAAFASPTAAKSSNFSL